MGHHKCLRVPALLPVVLLPGLAPVPGSAPGSVLGPVPGQEVCRRPLSSSLFALVYALVHFDRFYTESGHPWARKAWISIQFVYLVVNLAVVLVLPALFYLSIYYIMAVKLIAIKHINDLTFMSYLHCWSIFIRINRHHMSTKPLQSNDHFLSEFAGSK